MTSPTRPYAVSRHSPTVEPKAPLVGGTGHHPQAQSTEFGGDEVPLSGRTPPASRAEVGSSTGAAGESAMEPAFLVGTIAELDGWRLSAESTVLISSLLSSDSPRTAGEDLEHVRILAEARGALPPIIVHRATMQVVDGMHRLKAAQARGEQRIAVRFFDGDEQDAFVLAVRANVTHGLPLTFRDRTAAAVRILTSHPAWADRAIAAIVGLSDKSVKEIRLAAGGEAAETQARIGRDGRRRPVDQAAGRLAARELIEQMPEASNRRIARLAGVSPATARDVRNRLNRGEDPLPPSHRARKPQPPERPAEPSRGRAPRTPEMKRAQDFSKALDSLTKDPSMRQSENGRALLRGLSLHTALQEHLADLICAIPQHRAGMVSELARTCAAVWLQLAEETERQAVSLPKGSR